MKVCEGKEEVEMEIETQRTNTDFLGISNCARVKIKIFNDYQLTIHY